MPGFPHEKLSFNMDFEKVFFESFETDDIEQLNLDRNTHSTVYSYVPDEIAYNLPYRLSICGHFLVGNHHLTKREGREGYQCIYTKAGSCSVKIGDSAPITCEKGSVMILDCYHPHSYYTVDNNHWEYKHFHFDAPHGEYLVQQLLGKTDFADSVEANIDSLFEQIEKPTAISSYLISDTISHLLTKLIKIRQKTIITNNSHMPQLENIAAYLREHYSEKINISELSASEYISRYYFIRLFKECFGVTPYTYLNNVRINHSKGMLSNHQLSVEEISYKCGFGNANNFNRIFKRSVGVTPSEFRKNWTDWPND